MIILRQKEFARKDYLVFDGSTRNNVMNRFIAGKRRVIAKELWENRKKTLAKNLDSNDRDMYYRMYLDRSKKRLRNLEIERRNLSPAEMEEIMKSTPKFYEKGYRESWLPKRQETPPYFNQPSNQTSSPKLKEKVDVKGAILGGTVAVPMISAGVYLGSKEKTYSGREKVPAEIEEKARSGEGVIQKDSKGVWRIISLRTHPAEYWNAHYKTREDAEKALGAYHAGK